MTPGESLHAAIWAELRRLAYLIAELADRVTSLEQDHDDDTEEPHAHGCIGEAVRADPPSPDER